MVFTNLDDSEITGPYQQIKKDKMTPTSNEFQKQTQHQQSNKNDQKYGVWGPVYKNKENFVNMHIC